MSRDEALAGVRVLVVEDDRSMGEQLARGLTRAGCQVELVGSAGEALPRADADMILLDLGLPDGDGIDLCGQLRQLTSAPIVVVTARDTERQRVTALDNGADDYIAKPFGFAELLARMRAVLRRTRPEAERGTLSCGPLTIDVAGRRVEMHGEPVALTGKEFDILVCLASEPGRVITREEIFDRAWDVNWYGPMKVLDVHIASLRRKLGDPSLIETVYGRGFRLRKA
ncbi:MAG TPA: response regulator transcription factor [Mycobacteriales bacterium]|nr:response regulator transcription factor [Mycobacteriales bacterium]